VLDQRLDYERVDRPSLPSRPSVESRHQPIPRRVEHLVRRSREHHPHDVVPYKQALMESANDHVRARLVSGSSSANNPHCGLLTRLELRERIGNNSPTIVSGWFAWCCLRPTHRLTYAGIQIG
jgi:hypothetical protein